MSRTEVRVGWGRRERSWTIPGTRVDMEVKPFVWGVVGHRLDTPGGRGPAEGYAWRSGGQQEDDWLDCNVHRRNHGQSIEDGVGGSASATLAILMVPPATSAYVVPFVMSGDGASRRQSGREPSGREGRIRQKTERSLWQHVGLDVCPDSSTHGWQANPFKQNALPCPRCTGSHRRMKRRAARRERGSHKYHLADEAPLSGSCCQKQILRNPDTPHPPGHGTAPSS